MYTSVSDTARGETVTLSLCHSVHKANIDAAIEGKKQKVAETLSDLTMGCAIVKPNPAVILVHDNTPEKTTSVSVGRASKPYSLQQQQDSLALEDWSSLFKDLSIAVEGNEKLAQYFALEEELMHKQQTQFMSQLTVQLFQHDSLHLKYLELCEVRLAQKYWIRLAAGLATTTTLSTLHIDNCGLKDDSKAFFCKLYMLGALKGKQQMQFTYSPRELFNETAVTTSQDGAVIKESHFNKTLVYFLVKLLLQPETVSTLKIFSQVIDNSPFARIIEKYRQRAFEGDDRIAGLLKEAEFIGNVWTA